MPVAIRGALLPLITLPIAALLGCGESGSTVDISSSDASRTSPDGARVADLGGGPPELGVGGDAGDRDGTSGLPDAGPPPPELPVGWRVLVAANAPEGVRQAARDVEHALDAMGRAAELDEAFVGEVACAPGAGQVALTGDSIPGGELQDPGAATDQTYRIEERRCEDGVLVLLSGGGLLGRQYAAYEWLHHLGVRFFHPEQTYLPPAPRRWPDPLVREHTPAFRFRSVSLHLTHPLELGDPFRGGDERYLPEVKRYIDWEVQNLASVGKSGIGDGALQGYGLRRGFPRQAGFSLHNQQQGGGGVIDPDDPRSEAVQIAEAIDSRMGVSPTPKILAFTFNPSEFTEIDDQDAVRQMTLIADHVAARYPGTILLTINHGSAGPPTAHYGVRFYDLPRFAPANLGVKVHPLMFYDLFRPAPVYGNSDFGFLFDFMVDTYQTRRLWYFPESAWWLTFDIAVPLYLPITIEARSRDIEGIAFMLAGGLDGHRVFGSGHEWGYWQNEYCSFRMAADLAYGWRDCLADLTWPMGGAAGEVQAVLERIVALQERDLIYGDILAYLVGSDPETEAAAAVGVRFHPLPPSPRSVLGWDEGALRGWRDRIESALRRMDQDYSRQLDRLRAVAAEVPEAGGPWFREILDGVEVTGLRARHAWQAYGAVVAFREAQLRLDPGGPDAAAALLAQARATTDEVLAVVARREADYRYRPIERSIAGGPEGTEDVNWTIYRYRYLNRAHHAFYYRRTDDQVAEALGGGGDAVSVSDTLLGAGETLRLAVRDPSQLDEISADFGDGAAESGPQVSHRYPSIGLYTVDVTGTFSDGAALQLQLPVARVSGHTATGFTGHVSAPAGVELIDPMLPGLVYGNAGDNLLALGFSTEEGGRVGPDRWTALPLAPEGLSTQPSALRVPVINRGSGEVLARLLIEDAVLTFATPVQPLRVAGRLATESIVQALVAIGGFEQAGARALVAQTLGFTPDTLPASVDFAVDYPAAR